MEIGIYNSVKHLDPKSAIMINKSLTQRDEGNRRNRRNRGNQRTGRNGRTGRTGRNRRNRRNGRNRHKVLNKNPMTSMYHYIDMSNYHGPLYSSDITLLHIVEEDRYSEVSEASDASEASGEFYDPNYNSDDEYDDKEYNDAKYYNDFDDTDDDDVNPGGEIYNMIKKK